MKPENRVSVASFLMETKPVTDKGWTETRMAFKWGDHTFLIYDNWPHWTTTKILDFCKTQNLEVFDLEVKVTPNNE